MNKVIILLYLLSTCVHVHCTYRVFILQCYCSALIILVHPYQSYIYMRASLCTVNEMIVYNSNTEITLSVLCVIIIMPELL